MKVLKILIGVVLVLILAIFILFDSTICHSHMFPCPWS